MNVIGRDVALEELNALFGEENKRCVTLVGPGGVGKTTLAQLFVKAQKTPTLFADLTESRSLESAASKIAIELAVPLTNAKSTEAIVEQLANALDTDDCPLLVLDNCEQAVNEIAELIAGLSSSVEQLRVLCTSREALAFSDESVYELPFLDEASALELFEARAKEAAPRFEMQSESERNAAALIVKKLDLLPLAIELAAARLEVMTLEQLAARLDDQLRLLRRSGKRATRHATLQNTIAWSWELLDESEQLCLMQCGVFHDGFSLEAAEAVVQLDDWAADALHGLKRKSLVSTRRVHGQLRFRLMESVRAYALLKLYEHPQHKEVVLRHAAYFSSREDRPWLSHHKESRAVLTSELENLMAAHTRSLEQGEDLFATFSALTLAQFFAAQGPPNIQSRVLDAGTEAARRLAKEGEQTHLCSMLLARAASHRVHARLDDAQKDLDEVEPLAKALGPLFELEFQTISGTVYFMQGRYDEAKASLLQATEHEGTPGAARWVGIARMRSGSLAMVLGDDALGERSLTRALPLLESAQDDSSMGTAHINLAVVHLDRGEHEKAAAALDDAESLLHGVRDRWSLASCSVNRGLLDLDIEQYDEAEVRFRATLREATLLNNKRLEAYARLCLGVTSHLQDELSKAQARLVAACEVATAVGEVPILCGAQSHLGTILHKMGDTEGAAGCFQKAYEAAENYPHPWIMRLVKVLDQHREEPDAARVFLDETDDVPTHVRLSKRLVRAFHAGTMSVPSAEGLVIPKNQLIIGEEARWLILPDGEKLDLQRRGPLRRILFVLGQVHAEGKALDVHELIEAGWPGEKIHPESGAARVYAAVRTIRKLGLEPWLQTRDDGYLLDPELSIAFA